jgi:ATP-dependent protease ClpP protease subunit
MFKLEKLTDRAVLTIYGYVGGAYMDFRSVNAAIDDITNAGYKKLDFRIHTYGGDVFEGNLIYNFIAGFDGEVDFYIDGVAASMGSIIVRSGGRVFIADNGFQMIHAPQGGGYGTAKQLIERAKLLTSMEKNFTKNLMEATGKPEEEVSKWFDGTDYWFDADECVALGLATGKFSPKVKNIKSLDKSEAMQIGAKATYDRFAATLIAEANSTNPLSKKPNEMDKIELIKRYGLTGVTAESTDEQVLAAVDAKVNAGLEESKKATTKMIVAVVAQAVKDKKITKEQTAKYEEMGEKLGVDDLTAMFADMKVYEPITPKLIGKGGNGANAEDRSAWTWDDFQAKASTDLEAMQKSDPETFKTLYKAKYDVDPEL